MIVCSNYIKISDLPTIIGESNETPFDFKRKLRWKLEKICLKCEFLCLLM